MEQYLGPAGRERPLGVPGFYPAPPRPCDRACCAGPGVQPSRAFREERSPGYGNQAANLKVQVRRPTS